MSTFRRTRDRIDSYNRLDLILISYIRLKLSILTHNLQQNDPIRYSPQHIMRIFNLISISIEVFIGVS